MENLLREFRLRPNFILVILDYTQTNFHKSEQYLALQNIVWRMRLHNILSIYSNSGNYVTGIQLKPAYNVMEIAGFRSGKKIKKEPMSNEQKLILSKKKGVEHHRYGVKHTEKTLTLMRENHPKIEAYRNFAALPLNCISIFSG
jgi:hypothetical protein